MSQLDLDTLLGRLRRCEGTGRLDGLEIEFWVGGGQPPPFYRSEQFRLLTVGDVETVEFATVAYAPAFEFAGLTLKFQLPAQPDDVRQVARRLRETGVFTTRYAEEDDPQAADVLRTEVLVTLDGRQQQRVYYCRLPEALAPLKAEVGRLISLAPKQGKLVVSHQGVQLGA